MFGCIAWNYVKKLYIPIVKVISRGFLKQTYVWCGARISLQTHVTTKFVINIHNRVKGGTPFLLASLNITYQVNDLLVYSLNIEIVSVLASYTCNELYIHVRCVSMFPVGEWDGCFAMRRSLTTDGYNFCCLFIYLMRYKTEGNIPRKECLP